MRSLRSRRRAPAPLNVTALLDVLLILLVLMMLSAPLAMRKLSVSVPDVSAFAAPQAVKSVVLELDRDGNWRVQGNPVAWEQLSVLVNDARVSLAADASLPYRDVASALSRLKGAGAREIALLLR